MDEKPNWVGEVGEALYGGRWKTDLARDLGVTYRTVLRWTSGETEPSREQVERLYQIAKQRRLLAEIAATLVAKQLGVVSPWAPPAPTKVGGKGE